MQRVKGGERRYWSMLTAYGRFEELVALLLGMIITVVIVQRVTPRLARRRYDGCERCDVDLDHTQLSTFML